MELAALVAHALLACAQCSKVLRRLRRRVRKQLKSHATCLGVSDLQVEENLWILHAHRRLAAVVGHRRNTEGNVFVA